MEESKKLGRKFGMSGPEVAQNFGFPVTNIDPYNTTGYGGMFSLMAMGSVRSPLAPLFQRGIRAGTNAVYAYANGENINQAVSNNEEAIDHLVDELENRNTLFKRMFNVGRDDVPELLDPEDDPAKIVGAVIKYGERKGDPAALIGHTENFWTWGNADFQNNSALDHLADAAINAGSPRLAALMIKEAGRGIQANDHILQKLLVDSKEKLGSGHSAFIAATAKQFKELNNGENMAEFVKEQYSNSQISIGGLNIGGTSEKGQEFVNIINKAYKKSEGMGKNAMPMMMAGAMMPGMMMPGMYS